MAQSTRIFLCRHAHPDNPDGVFYGHLPGFGLSALGVRQAIGLGDHLARYPIQRIYASPLQRAQETANIARGRLDGDVPVETREQLVEAAFGKYLQGVKQARAVVLRPLFWVHLFSPGRLDFDETVTAMADRVEGVLAEAREGARGQAAAVVSHADPIKAFWNRYLRRADWRFHFLELAKGGFLELVYSDDELVAVHPHRPLDGGEAPGPAARPGLVA